jgi:DDE superfamily endonuclease
MQPGKPERIEYEYIRHGTLCLIGNWDVVTGQIIAPTIGQTRTEQDIERHIDQMIQTDPHAGWVIVMDNLNVHCSESLVRYVAKLEDIDESTLGIKGKSGILKSMATRQAFLTKREHRVRFVFTPKHSASAGRETR